MALLSMASFTKCVYKPRLSDAVTNYKSSLVRIVVLVVQKPECLHDDDVYSRFMTGSTTPRFSSATFKATLTTDAQRLQSAMVGSNDFCVDC